MEEKEKEKRIKAENTKTKFRQGNLLTEATEFSPNGNTKHIREIYAPNLFHAYPNFSDADSHASPFCTLMNADSEHLSNAMLFAPNHVRNENRALLPDTTGLSLPKEHTEMTTEIKKKKGLKKKDNRKVITINPTDHPNYIGDRPLDEIIKHLGFEDEEEDKKLNKKNKKKALGKEEILLLNQKKVLETEKKKAKLSKNIPKLIDKEKNQEEINVPININHQEASDCKEIVIKTKSKLKESKIVKMTNEKKTTTQDLDKMEVDVNSDSSFLQIQKLQKQKEEKINKLEKNNKIFLTNKFSKNKVVEEKEKVFTFIKPTFEKQKCDERLKLKQNNNKNFLLKQKSEEKLKTDKEKVNEKHNIVKPKNEKIEKLCLNTFIIRNPFYDKSYEEIKKISFEDRHAFLLNILTIMNPEFKAAIKLRVNLIKEGNQWKHVEILKFFDKSFEKKDIALMTKYGCEKSKNQPKFKKKHYKNSSSSLYRGG